MGSTIPKTTKQFIEEAIQVHGNTFNYSKVKYVNAGIKVCIVCKIHGEFYQKPTVHLRGFGCKSCSNDRSRLRLMYTLDDFLKKAKSIHGDRFDYSRVVYSGCHSPVELICNIHGSFFVKPYVHLQGHICKLCSNTENAIALTATTSQFIAKAEAVHEVGTYDYSKSVYVRRNVPLIIQCSTHGEFKLTPAAHIGLRKQGCPKCSNYSTHSKVAITWIESEARARKMKNVKHAKNGGEYVIPSTNFRVDGFHKPTNTIFEFHGDRFHGNLEVYKPRSRPNPFSNKTAQRLYRETKAREAFLLALGYRLIVVWESDYKKSMRFSYILNPN
jgi:hypothetical protein